MKKLIVSMVVLFVLLVAGTYWQYNKSINQSYITEQMGPTLVTVERGQNLQQIITTLNTKGVVDGYWFKWLVRWEGA